MKIAIIGCGLIGQKRAKLLKNVDIACDINLSNAQKISNLFPNCLTTINIDDVVNSDVDVVFISVINSFLFSIAEKLILKGKHILLEKPGGINVDELKKLKSISEKTNSLIRIGYNHRYHPACIKAQEIINDPSFGKIMYLRGRYGHGGRLGYEKEWRSNKEFSGGGELIDQGVHLIDLSNLFLGNIDIIEGHIHTYYWNMSVEDNAFISLQNKNKNTAWLHVSCTEWKNMFSFEIYGQFGKVSWDGLGGSYGVERLTYYKMLEEMGPPETTIFEYPMGDKSWEIEMNEFFNDIRLNRQPIPGIDEGIEVLKVVDQLYKNI